MDHGTAERISPHPECWAKSWDGRCRFPPVRLLILSKSQQLALKLDVVAECTGSMPSACATRGCIWTLFSMRNSTTAHRAGVGSPRVPAPYYVQSSVDRNPTRRNSSRGRFRAEGNCASREHAYQYCWWVKIRSVTLHFLMQLMHHRITLASRWPLVEAGKRSHCGVQMSSNLLAYALQVSADGDV
ncbi:hypothetical protein P152DRAFT_94740 [Eremomyces bilateralis CBS 781.70]|uniref:Uncharacterized protein n=1 Tax=Eremomyces bilateralis CBS 781.70 TaxID=1392243 RepID=A0A6G1FX46_9PEZI|nr:uncharacterized protein P152DRAFT_94740 [Eremomyces bilateralis CBS 781.70]KAF1810318.1 hypothetical protein P152DRAFT_94740 [Eremomyces bilateralis CBS 781.70]